MSNGCWRRVIATSSDRRGVGRGQQDGTDRRRKESTNNRSLTMPPFMVFLLFIGSISKNGPERIRQPFSREASPSVEASPRENPSGHEVGISLRPITLLPDEKKPKQTRRPASGSPGVSRRREIATSPPGIRPAVVRGGGLGGPYPRRSSVRRSARSPGWWRCSHGPSSWRCSQWKVLRR